MSHGHDPIGVSAYRTGPGHCGFLVGGTFAALKQLAAAFKGQTIGQATKFRAIEKALQGIAASAGQESARQARTVWGKYVAGQMLRDELINANPIRRERIDITDDKEHAEAVRALTANELNRVLDWLMELDPEEGIQKPARGRWSREGAIAKRRNVIDLTLLQATSGMRVSEANALTWEVFDEAAKITKSKTHKGRTIPLLFPDVVNHLKQRPRTGRYVIGAPTNQDKQWDRDAARKTAAQFYPEIGRATDTEEVFHTGRTHLWRKTLNMVTKAAGVDDETRAAYFGHDTTTNQQSYADDVDVSPMVTAAQKVRQR